EDAENAEERGGTRRNAEERGGTRRNAGTFAPPRIQQYQLLERRGLHALAVASVPPRTGQRVPVLSPRVVAEHDLARGDALDVLGEQRDLAAAAGCIDHEVRDAQPAGPAAQRADDLEALLDGRAEVLAAGDDVRLIDVVGPDARL